VRHQLYRLNLSARHFRKAAEFFCAFLPPACKWSAAAQRISACFREQPLSAVKDKLSFAWLIQHIDKSSDSYFRIVIVSDSSVLEG
jgi:hypothetical protein